MSKSYDIEVKRDPVEFVRIGYNDASINWLAVFHRYDHDQLVKAIKQVTEYNNFTGTRVATAVEVLKGSYDKISFGREGSPVLYIEPRLWDSEAGCKMDATRIAALIQRIADVFKNTRHDEYHVGVNFQGQPCIRIWWD